MVATGILAALQRFTSKISEESVTEQSQSVNDDPVHSPPNSPSLINPNYPTSQLLAIEAAKNPPDPNKERIETQQDEVSKVTKEEQQNKREDDADNEVISQVGRTDLVAYNAEKAGSKASLLPAPPQVSYNTQSFSAKGEQVSPSTPPDNEKHPPLNEFPTTDQNIPSNVSVGKVTEQSQSVNHGPPHSPPNSPTPTHQILPIPQLLKLLKLPPDFPPSHLPLFILDERETNPKELLKRLMETSEAETFIEVLTLLKK